MSEYIEITKQLGLLQHKMREYRLTSVRKQLMLIVKKDRRIKELEDALMVNLGCVLQNHYVINEILDELEAIL